MNNVQNTLIQSPFQVAGTARKQIPVWPLYSIALLVILAATLSPGLITGLNFLFLIFSLIVWAASNKKLDGDLALAIAPYILITAVGLAMGINANKYLYFKDAWYVCNPALILAVGYILYCCRPDVRLGLAVFAVSGSLISLIFLRSFVLDPHILTLPATDIRVIAGLGFYATTLSFTILVAYFGRWPIALHLPKLLGYACLAVDSCALILSFSRTMFILAVVGVLVTAGYFSKRALPKLLLVLLVALLGIFAARLTIDMNSKVASTSILGKFARSFDELTISNYRDFKSINLNWRGYEAARAIKTYSTGSVYQLVFGRGFGAQVDLGFYMQLGGGTAETTPPVRLIPVLHNGYAYLLVKSGPVGIALFLWSMGWLFAIGRKFSLNTHPGESTIPARLLQACAISLTFTTWVIAGVFNKLDMFPYLLAAGYLLAALTTKRETLS